MKKFILSILLILFISIPGFAQYGQLGGGISGITFDGNGLVFGAPADSAIFEIPVSVEASLTLQIMVTTGITSSGPIDVTVANTTAGGETAVQSQITHATNALTGTLIGVRGNARVNIDSPNGTVQGGKFQAGNTSTGSNLGVATGVYSEVVNKIPSGNKTWSYARAYEANLDLNQGSSSNVTTFTNAYLFYGVYNLPTSGSFTTVTNGWGIFLRNEQVGGNGQMLDAALYVDDLNMGGGIKGWDFGIDFSGIEANFGTADWRMSDGATINNTDADNLVITEANVDVTGNLTAGTMASDGLITANGAFTSPGIDDNADATAITIDVTTEKVNFSADADVVANLTAGTITSDAGVTGTVLSAIGGQDADATLILDADAGDDNTDTWKIISEATGNDLSIVNHTTEVFNLTSAGNLQVDGTVTSGLSGGTTGQYVITVSDGDLMNISGNTSDQMLFKDASLYIFDGDVLIGGTALISINSSFEVQGSVAIHSMVRTSGNTSGSTLQFIKNRSGGVITTGDNLLTISAFGHDGTDNFGLGAIIAATSTGTIASNKIPTNLIFSTAAGVAENDVAEKMRIESDGDVFVTVGDFETAAYNRQATLSFNDCFDRAEAVQYAQNWDINALNVTGTGTNVITTTPSHITLQTDGVGNLETEGTRSNFAMVQRARQNRSEWCIELGQTAETNFFLGWNTQATNTIAADDKFVLIVYQADVNANWQLWIDDGAGASIDKYVSSTAASTDEIEFELYTEVDGTIHWFIDGVEETHGLSELMQADNHYIIVCQLQTIDATQVSAECDFIINEKFK